MSLCKCEYVGRLDSDEHRRHHRAWERSHTGYVTTDARTVEITDVYVTLDQIIAALHGGPRPELTPGAQAILAREGNRT